MRIGYRGAGFAVTTALHKNLLLAAEVERRGELREISAPIGIQGAISECHRVASQPVPVMFMVKTRNACMDASTLLRPLSG